MAVSFCKSKTRPAARLYSLPFIWVSMESLHKYWSFDFPWLWLGNGFATQVEWVQWYEHVGVFGGSWWIWLVNLSYGPLPSLL
ncbi:MAG: hypothetical protein U5L96_14155 [Owenweeksia sp.]|nr:hypothetical protein [Owenweeksia sp.]